MKNVLSIKWEGCALSVLCTAIAAVFDKVPTLLILFMVAVVLDYLTGWIKAAFFLREWNSKTGLQGVIKKLMYFVMIGTAFLVGWGIREMGDVVGINLDFAILIGWYVTAVMLVNELTSILENLYVIMPDKVPVWLVKVLKIADSQLDSKINDIICKDQDCNDCDLRSRCNFSSERRKHNDKKY